MNIKCNKCGHVGPESEFPKGSDLFQNQYIAGCPKCDKLMVGFKCAGCGKTALTNDDMPPNADLSHSARPTTEDYAKPKT